MVSRVCTDLRDLPQPAPAIVLLQRRRDLMQQQLLANARELSQAIEQWNQLINADHTTCAPSSVWPCCPWPSR